MPIKPVDLKKVEEKTSNVYEAVIVVAKKARIINDANKLEYNTLISTMIGVNDDDFDDRENPDQLRISLEFEKRKKPQLNALDELLNGEIAYRYKETTE